MTGVKLKSIPFFSGATEDGCLSEELWLRNLTKTLKKFWLNCQAGRGVGVHAAMARSTRCASAKWSPDHSNPLTAAV